MNTTRHALTIDQQYRLANLLPVGFLVLSLDDQVIFYNEAFLHVMGMEDHSDEKVKENVYLNRLVEEVNTRKSQNVKSFSFIFDISSDAHVNMQVSVSHEDIILIAQPSGPSEDVEVASVQAILEGQENERRRIGREIHDGLGPLVSYVKFSFDTIVEQISSQNFSQPELLKSISETIDIVSDDLRSLSHRLVPRTLDEFGLYSAFNNLISKLNETKKLNIEFYTNMKSESRFNDEIELNIFRCAQEVINNAIKYAKASHILVQIIQHKHSIILMVEDDGVGFVRASLGSSHQGIGLTNVETRVRLLEGEFNLDSEIGRGTVVSIEIPIKCNL
ncbi:sensor histidine kinase [Saccharicrinis fermentans]|uniref:Oxygen sensor histidine kinase NreB n=1 Tax=Saccharicrinis fermentans DSM 9555 = JCM 21142 TaxID=869213 RepID=W7YLG3_9BACT|nr:ATP-binding protein [Saccharicrinis fermentans]GAF03219.1 oxygen sensor histidine kinase NreB [Saccharicrinis fermentans DSM 9555 = JCM 21142]